MGARPVQIMRRRGAGERPAFPELKSPGISTGGHAPIPALFSFAQVTISDVVDALTKRADNGAIIRALGALEQSTGVQLQVGEAMWPLLLALIARCDPPPSAHSTTR
jgi:hypothetical protein